MKSAIKTMLRQCGWQLSRIDASAIPRHDAYADQQVLFAGRQPKIILDIGANYGQTALHYRSIFPDAQIHSFEPFDETFEGMKQRIAGDAAIFPHRSAVADKAGTTQFHVNESHYTNSLLATSKEAEKLAPGWTGHVKTIDVPVTTVDTFTSENGIEHVDILKIDVQGAELRVLKGAQRMLQLQAISVVYAEVYFSDVYEGQTDFCELNVFLRQFGFVLYGLYDLFYKSKLPLAWGDAIFISPRMLESVRA